ARSGPPLGSLRPQAPGHRRRRVDRGAARARRYVAEPALDPRRRRRRDAQRALGLDGGHLPRRQLGGLWTLALTPLASGASSRLAGMNDIARSASAVIVRLGFTPRFAPTAEPSTTNRLR